MKLAAMIKKMCPSDSELSIPAKNCYRMVILGSSKVGKTAIVSRFLTGRFEDAYTPTIEDFHRKFYSIRGEVYQLDILDTSGNHPFPAMRRLSILTGEWGPEPAAGRGGNCTIGRVEDPGSKSARESAACRCGLPVPPPHDQVFAWRAQRTLRAAAGAPATLKSKPAYVALLAAAFIFSSAFCPCRRRFHSGVQPGQPRLFRGGTKAQTANPRH